MGHPAKKPHAERRARSAGCATDASSSLASCFCRLRHPDPPMRTMDLGEGTRKHAEPCRGSVENWRSWRGRVFPNGDPSHSPGLRGTSYPGSTHHWNLKPQRGFVRFPRAPDDLPETKPRRGLDSRGSFSQGRCFAPTLGCGTDPRWGIRNPLRTIPIPDHVISTDVRMSEAVNHPRMRVTAGFV